MPSLFAWGASGLSTLFVYSGFQTITYYFRSFRILTNHIGSLRTKKLTPHYFCIFHCISDYYGLWHTIIDLVLLFSNKKTCFIVDQAGMSSCTTRRHDFSFHKKTCRPDNQEDKSYGWARKEDTSAFLKPQNIRYYRRHHAACHPRPTTHWQRNLPIHVWFMNIFMYTYIYIYIYSYT